MLKKALAAVAIVVSLSSAVSAQDAKTAIANASKAMGGDTLKTIQYSGSATEFSFGQAVNPNQPWPAWISKTYTRSINYETPATRLDRVLGDNPPTRRGGGLQPGPTQTIVVNANTPWQQQLDIVMTPHGFLKAAAMNNPTARSQTMGGNKYTVVTFKGQNKADVNGYINEQNLVERVETMFDNPVTGDTLFEATYSDYKDVGGGVKFPGKILLKQGGSPTLDFAVATVTPNAAVDIQPPAGRGGAPGGAPAGGAPAPPAAMSQKLADGVYLILGGYASVAVDFKDYIVVIEGGQSEARGTAIVNEVHKLIPNKPIRYVVNTHSHFDHSSGLRPFVADGATIITHESNKGYYEKIFTAPHTLVPDKLFETKAKITVETFGDKKVLTDGNHIVELYNLTGSPHSDGLIVAYLPKEKILVEADAWGPPADPNAPPPATIAPILRNMMENLDRLKLDYEVIVPVHYPADGRRITKADLMKFVGRGD
jgi:glyoxylase-like metal-dependent hydrolase (beta-lactamase superfamily II)